MLRLLVPRGYAFMACLLAALVITSGCDDGSTRADSEDPLSAVLLTTGGDDSGTVIHAERRGGASPTTFPRVYYGDAWGAVHMSPRGRYLVSLGAVGGIGEEHLFLLDVTIGKRVDFGRLRDCPGGGDIVFAPDEQAMIVQSCATISRYTRDAKSDQWRKERSFSARPGEVALAYSSTGLILFFDGRTARTWRIDAGSQIASYSTPPELVPDEVSGAIGYLTAGDVPVIVGHHYVWRPTDKKGSLTKYEKADCGDCPLGKSGSSGTLQAWTNGVELWTVDAAGEVADRGAIGPGYDRADVIGLLLSSELLQPGPTFLKTKYVA